MIRRQQILGGAYLLAVAMLLLPVSDALSKVMVADYPAVQVVFLRNLVHAVLLIGICVALGVRPRRGPVNMHLIRALCFVGMSVCFVAALKHLPLAETLAIVFLYPILTVFLARFWLSEATGAHVWLPLCLGCLGVALILGPGLRGAFHMQAVLLALGAACATAMYNTMTRRMRDQASAMDLAFWAPLLGVLCLLPFASTVWQPVAAADLWVFAMIGGLSAVVHGLIVLAYRSVSAARLAPLSYIQIATSVVVGWLLFGDWPGLYGWLGIACIVIGGALVLRPRAFRTG